MRARIHRGAHEVGGNCIELEHDGASIVLDLGMPLAARQADDVPLPDVPGLAAPDQALLGIVLSHNHLDHVGLVKRARAELPVFMGEAAARIVNEAAFFCGAGSAAHLRPAGFLRHRECLQIGPFRITPFLNDHSAFDAYSMLVEAGGRRLFYTGDFRGHGRKQGRLRELIARPPGDVDVLLMEGTHVRGSAGEVHGLTELDVENACVDLFRRAQGPVLALYSPQNIDRLVSIFRACRRSGRMLVMDLYSAAIAEATGNPSIPRAGWDNVRVHLPRRQKALVIRSQAFGRVDAVRTSRIFPEELTARSGRVVLTFRLSMSREIEDCLCLEGAGAFWSMWQGYLREAAGQELVAWLNSRQIPLSVIHSSGHASVSDLQRLVAALAPERVVPIHTAAPEAYRESFPGVELHPDGAWWTI